MRIVRTINTMSDTVDVDFFEEALKTEGLTNATVTHYRDAVRGTEVLRVKKRVDGEKIVNEQHITDREIIRIDNIQKHMAMLAAEIAREFEELITERREWGENCVALDLKDSLSATCHRCGTEVSMDDLRGGSMFMAETAAPRPPTPSFKNLPPVKIRLTLLALLRDECDPMCPNSPMDRNF